MSRILVVYGSAYGQTARIVQRIAEVLRAAQHEVTLYRGDDLPTALDPEDFDGYLIAGSVLYGRHQRYLRDFARRHRDALNTRPSAFVSVSGSAASPEPRVRAEVQAMVGKFLEASGWRPSVTRTFGGALAYTRYNWLLRRIIRAQVRRSGGPGDISRDYELTDWSAVDDLARELADLWARSGTAAAR